MATRMKPTPFKYKSEDGSDGIEPVVYEIDDNGIFTAIVPEWLIPNLRALPGFGNYGPQGIKLDRPRTNWRMSGRVKQDLDAWLSRAFEDFSKPEVTEELVIRYTWDAQAAFVTDKDGTVAQNGSFYQKMTGCSWREFPDGARWADMRSDISATNPCDGGFQIRLAAYVFNKTTVQRGAYKKVTYERAEDGHTSPDIENPIHALNGFLHQGGIKRDGSAQASRMSGYSVRVDEMPYTPEAAWFFVNALKSMCRMAKAMNDFFVDKEALQVAIQSGAGSFLPSPRKD